DALNVTGEPPATPNLSPRELEALWADLAGAEAAAAYGAMRALVAAPEQAVAHLRQHLQPIPAADPRHLGRLIADLDAEVSEARENPARELKKLGPLARPALRQTLAGKPSPEVRQRIEQLLKPPPPLLLGTEELRSTRSIEVLEQIGTPAAREVLVKLA